MAGAQFLPGVAHLLRAADRKVYFHEKYNRTVERGIPGFITTMGELDGERRVEKAALESAGRYHILSLKNKCRQLRQLNPGQNPGAGDGQGRQQGGSWFLKSITLAERLGRCIRDGRAPVEEIKAALQFLYDVAEDQIVPFAVASGLPGPLGRFRI